ncbi:hypothetical protein [Sphingomonas leidyi]
MVLGIGGISEVMRSREEELAAALKEQVDLRYGRASRNVVQMPGTLRDAPRPDPARLQAY